MHHSGQTPWKAISAQLFTSSCSELRESSPQPSALPVSADGRTGQWAGAWVQLAAHGSDSVRPECSQPGPPHSLHVLLPRHGRWSVQEQEMIPFRTLPSQVTPIGFPDSEPAGLVQRNVSSRLLLELQGRGRQCWPGRIRMPTVRGPQDAFSTRAQSLSKDWEKRRRAGWRAGETRRTRQNRHKCW